MRITINTFGSRGDIQPFIGLACGLQAHNHQVRITTHRVFEAFVREYGLDFYPLEIDPRQVLINQAVAEFGSNTFRITRWMQEHFNRGLDIIFRATLESAQGADLLINSSLSFAGWHVAEKLKKRSIAAYLQSVTPTTEFPGMAAKIPPSWLPLKGLYNYATTKVINQFFFRMLLPVTNECRQQVLGLPPLSSRYYWTVDSPHTPVPIIYGYSSHVLPKPANWDSSKQVTGYWFLDQGQTYQPPEELEDFLASGPTPIYIGFGSMVDHERNEITRMVIEALDRCGLRAILLGGWSELGGDSLPDTIYQVDEIPHDWLFPRVSAVVHHGGAGTTAAGLRAGKPTVVVSFFGDQSFWGWRVHELEAGPKWIPRVKLTAERLAAAIQQAVRDPSIKARAEEVGRCIRSEDGIGNAVSLIENGFGSDYRP